MSAAVTKKKLTREEYERYLPLVRRTAMKLARRLPAHVTVADLISYGWVGLLDAFERAKPGMDPEEFEAYAMFRVRGAALDYLRSLDPASRGARSLSRKVARAIADLTKESGGQSPEEDAIAKRLGMTLDAYRTAMEQLGRAGMNRVDMIDVDDLGASDDLPEERTSRQELKALVAKAIHQLPERHRLVLALYYQEERTLREIGAILDVSESRVCQIHTEAVHRLRAAVGKE